MVTDSPPCARAMIWSAFSLSFSFKRRVHQDHGEELLVCLHAKLCRRPYRFLPVSAAPLTKSLMGFTCGWEKQSVRAMQGSSERRGTGRVPTGNGRCPSKAPLWAGGWQGIWKEYPAGNAATLFSAAQAERIKPAVHSGGVNAYATDGPYLFHPASGKLLMLFSSLSETSYAIGLSVSDAGGVMGPWRHPAAPFFSGNGGHSMLLYAGRGTAPFDPRAQPDAPGKAAVFARAGNAGRSYGGVGRAIPWAGRDLPYRGMILCWR